MSPAFYVLAILGVCIPLGGIIYFLAKIHDAGEWERLWLRIIVIACFAIGVLFQTIAYYLQ